MKISKTTIAAVFLIGMALGYIGNLWQQASQKQHRLTCETCSRYEAPKDANSDGPDGRVGQDGHAETKDAAKGRNL